MLEKLSKGDMMGKYRAPSKKSKWYLPTEEYLTAVHYALRYPNLLNDLPPADSGSGIRYDKDRVQTSNQYDATSELAIRRIEIQEKIDKIEACIKEAAGGQDKYLKDAVCYGRTYYQLQDRGYLGSQYELGQMRQHFYYLLIQKI